MVTLEFKFPDTGEGVTEGKFLQWMVEEGEEIEEDQIVGEAETDKAVVDIPAPTDGTVTGLKVEPGDTVAVGDVIMTIDDNSSSDEETEETEEDSKSSEEDEVQSSERQVKKSSSSKDILALPKVRKLAEEKGIDLSTIKTGERITEEEVLEAVGSSTKTEEESSNTEKEIREDKESKNVKATPAVRRLAREEGVDLTEIEGSGRGGKITREDVLNPSEPKEDTSKQEKTVSETETTTERVEMSGVRKATAQKMTESRFTAPHVTHVEKIDVTELVELREKEKDNFDTHLTYLPFIIKAVLAGMEDYPELNAELDEENNEIVLKRDYNFNIAVDTDRGLLVPVVENVDEKSIIEIAEGIESAVERAQEGKVSRDEMESGTFSITNLGVIGVEEFTPIIYHPQTAILGIGSIKETAEVVEGEIKPRKTVKLSLSYDHRVIDGATGARFMKTVTENLENPEQLLMRL